MDDPCEPDVSFQCLPNRPANWNGPNALEWRDVEILRKEAVVTHSLTEIPDERSEIEVVAFERHRPATRLVGCLRPECASEEVDRFEEKRRWTGPTGKIEL